jgi:hypothetical protein
VSGQQGLHEPLLVHRDKSGHPHDLGAAADLTWTGSRVSGSAPTATLSRLPAANHVTLKGCCHRVGCSSDLADGASSDLLINNSLLWNSRATS